MGRVSSLEDTLEDTLGGHPWRTPVEDTLGGHPRRTPLEDTWRIPWRTVPEDTLGGHLVGHLEDTWRTPRRTHLEDTLGGHLGGHGCPPGVSSKVSFRGSKVSSGGVIQGVLQGGVLW
jgi:hypothetical protein